MMGEKVTFQRIILGLLILTVAGLAGSGTIGLNLTDDGSIRDEAGNGLLRRVIFKMPLGRRGSALELVTDAVTAFLG
jgi:hypothetical protein